MNSPFTKLHPSLKACKCGHIGTRTSLYNHFDQVRRMLKAHGDNPREFWAAHGEVPLNEDDPRIDLTKSLAASTRKKTMNNPQHDEQLDEGEELCPICGEPVDRCACDERVGHAEGELGETEASRNV